MEGGRAAGHGDGRTAPWYRIPPRRIVAVEHPGVIQNIDRGLQTLKGSDGIAKILNPPKPSSRAMLYLRPEDPMARPLQSTTTQTNNVLLKVTVPKWTGRRRKRGSNGPWEEDPAFRARREQDGVLERRDARMRMRSLRDNVGRYTIEPVGRVERTHVFRTLPDYVFSSSASPFTQRFRETILTFDFEKMKQFDLDMSRGNVKDVDMIRPPSLSNIDVPFHYMYRQNPTVRLLQDTSGQITSINTQQAAKVLTYLVPYDVAVIPSEPREACPPLETQEPVLQETVAVLKKLFEERPAWTRRALRNMLKTNEQRYALRHAVAYVGYIFRSGPWRDAIVRLGCDPRTDPEFRKYQTFIFRIDRRDAEVSRDGRDGRRNAAPRSIEPLINNNKGGTDEEASTSHLFTGHPPLPLDGKIWMLCDIVDPIIKGILFPENPPPGFLREECDPVVDGWFGEGTLAKAKTIMRNKIHAMTQNQPVPDDSEFECILPFPDHVRPDDENLAEFFLPPEVQSSRATQLATEVRATVKGSMRWRSFVKVGGDSSSGAAGGGSREKVAAEGARDKGQPAPEDEEAALAQRVMMDEEADEGEEEAYEREELGAQAAAALTEAAETQLKRKRPVGHDSDGDEEMVDVEDTEDEDME